MGRAQAAPHDELAAVSDVAERGSGGEVSQDMQISVGVEVF